MYFMLAMFLNAYKFSVMVVLGTVASIVISKCLICTFFKRRKRNTFILIESIEKWNMYEEEIINTFRKSKVIGMDCEWVTVDNKRKPISLLQLANESGYCVLIRLSFIPTWLLPLGLSELLADRSVLKVGVGIYEDVQKLFHDYCLEVQGFIDLRFLARDLSEVQGKGLGLKMLGKELLGVNLNKSKSLRCSNWDAQKLSDAQIHYAGDDAIIAAQLFTKIKKRKLYNFTFFPKFQRELDAYIDMPFKQAAANINTAKKNISNPLMKSYKTRYSMPRQKPMYDNCQLVAPDGELLCSCDKGKAEWYVYKGLGEVIAEEPFTVKLKFEPSGRPTLDNVFYTKEKLNCCVVCGKSENFHRKLVVPSEYRRYFPNLMKKNLSHDVLLLCVNCHKISNILDQRMRQKLAEECNAPLSTGKFAKYKLNPELARVKSAAVALSASGCKIPDNRKKELEKIILDFYNIDCMTEELLNKACDVDVSILNESYVPHGLKVYQYFCKNGGLIQFERMWRQHFLDCMKPKFLPAMWSVEHNHKRLALQVLNHEREVNFDASILSPDLVKETEQCQI